MNRDTGDSILAICNSLITDFPCDFVGLATPNEQGQGLRWKYAAGNRNDKYKRIIIRYGKGIAGQVYRTGRMMRVESFPNNISERPTEYPIMLAEQLVSSIAVPLFRHKAIWGVLLIGDRKAVDYTVSQEECIRRAAAKIERFIERDS